MAGISSMILYTLNIKKRNTGGELVRRKLLLNLADKLTTPFLFERLNNLSVKKNLCDAIRQILKPTHLTSKVATLKPATSAGMLVMPSLSGESRTLCHICRSEKRKRKKNRIM